MNFFYQLTLHLFCMFDFAPNMYKPMEKSYQHSTGSSCHTSTTKNTKQYFKLEMIKHNYMYSNIYTFQLSFHINISNSPTEETNNVHTFYIGSTSTALFK